jgi:hypothetical protein
MYVQYIMLRQYGSTVVFETEHILLSFCTYKIDVGAYFESNQTLERTSSIFLFFMSQTSIVREAQLT